MLASQQVVEAMAGRLVAAAIVGAGQVEWRNRARVFSAWPGIKVYSTDEDLADDPEDITWPRQRQHTLQVQVDTVVRDPADPEGAMSALALQVLLTLEGTEAASLLQPLGARLGATRITRRMATENEASVGTVSIAMEIIFATRSDDPETIL